MIIIDAITSRRGGEFHSHIRLWFDSECEFYDRPFGNNFNFDDMHAIENDWQFYIINRQSKHTSCFNGKLLIKFQIELFFNDKTSTHLCWQFIGLKMLTSFCSPTSSSQSYGLDALIIYYIGVSDAEDIEMFHLLNGETLNKNLVSIQVWSMMIQCINLHWTLDSRRWTARGENRKMRSQKGSHSVITHLFGAAWNVCAVCVSLSSTTTHLNSQMHCHVYKWKITRAINNHDVIKYNRWRRSQAS